MTERIAYRAHEAAEALGVPYRTVLDLIRKGEIEARKVGRYYLIHRGELDRLFRNAAPARSA